MTRINLVEPSTLSDQHLIAEYREIFMVGSALQRSLKSKNWSLTKKTLPEEFTLNKGHVKFFYNKGKYLHKRYLAIVDEMKARGMKPDPKRIFKKDQWPQDMYNEWKPKNKDLMIIMQRIQHKINKKPEWYRWTERRDVSG
ncbi:MULTISPECIES: pyrimidine dimer DNA glycosylase/endonuclease V [Prochlorococcus]|uniref:pyrimidine dimer DNA glycosylase/endonuclease V n=1 Tax=Prochlorococcus TaxID=1218 RepID=UPI000533A3DC|nr:MULTISPECIES: pyrimidine dimer DNA glycosylase/endonuclease V [Prochlorococcus]KGG12155.1 Pyrimidine dimer DNA glycosylase [Prochlorococcus sp. MIT 0601]